MENEIYTGLTQIAKIFTNDLTGLTDLTLEDEPTHVYEEYAG
ncbi:15362_t:CDS:2 [Entrophospora sp. SA101]|nr:15362_t:CDS:2 [Entrophospora sp. SA101]